MARSFFQSLLAFITLGMVAPGCNKPDKTAAPETPASAADVTLSVPAMN